MEYQTILSAMLMVPILASARMVPRASNSSDTMQLTCTTGFQALDCLSFYGTSCSAAGVVQNPGSASMPTNGDCTSKHCNCQMAPPPPCFTETGTRGSAVVCGPYASGLSTLFSGTETASTGNAPVATPTGSMTTVPSGSACATVTKAVTITQHHREDNGSCPFSHTGSFSRHHNKTAIYHHHKSTSSTSVMTQTQSASFFSLTVVPHTTIFSISLISLTGNPVPPPSAPSLTGQPKLSYA